MSDQNEFEDPLREPAAGRPGKYVEFRPEPGAGKPIFIKGSLASPGDWYRAGRGLTSEVGFPTRDVVEQAIGALPAAWAPYHLLVVTKVQLGRRYVEMVRVANTARLDEIDGEAEWDYFLWSPTLTPELTGPLEFGYIDARASDVLSLSGLPNLRYRPRFNGREEPTRVGCVHKIQAYESSELVLHPEYEKVYRSFRRSLRQTGSKRLA